MIKIELTRFEVEDIITASPVVADPPKTEEEIVPEPDPISCECDNGCITWMGRNHWVGGRYGHYCDGDENHQHSK